MFLAAVAVLAVAALATLANTRTQIETQDKANQDQEKAYYGNYTRYTENAVRFVN